MQKAELKINQYLTLKLINGKTKIYVAGQEFLICKSIVLNIPKTKIKSVKTMDDLIDVSEITKGDEYDIDPKTTKIPKKNVNGIIKVILIGSKRFR